MATADEKKSNVVLHHAVAMSGKSSLVVAPTADHEARHEPPPPLAEPAPHPVSPYPKPAVSRDAVAMMRMANLAHEAMHAPPPPPADPPLVIRDEVGREIRIGMRVGCRNAGEPCDRSVRGLTLVDYEPGTDRPYVTNAGRFAVALLDHQPHMERWAAENVRSGGQQPPTAEPPAEAVRVVLRGTLHVDEDELVRVAIEDGLGDLLIHPEPLYRDQVKAIRSLLPAGWPRDQLGHAKGPLLKLRPHMNSNECRRALSEAFGKIPEPQGGWRGRDAVMVGAIHGLCTMFAPYDDPSSSAWWTIQDALAAVAQLADEVEVGL